MDTACCTWPSVNFITFLYSMWASFWQAMKSAWSPLEACFGVWGQGQVAASAGRGQPTPRAGHFGPLLPPCIQRVCVTLGGGNVNGLGGPCDSATFSALMMLLLQGRPRSHPVQAAACNQAKTHGIPCAESRSALPARLLPSLGSGGKPGASWGSLRLCPCAGIRRTPPSG